MEYELGSCRPDEIIDLGKLANRVFRASGEGDMVREYPLLMVPENAVSYDAQKNAFVQVPDKNQKDGTHKVAVVVGLSNGSQTEIVKGLKEGDQVVLQQ